MRKKSMAAKSYMRRKNTVEREAVEEGGNGAKNDAMTVENPIGGKEAEITNASPNKKGEEESEANEETNREDDEAKTVAGKKDSAKTVEIGTTIETEASSSNEEDNEKSNDNESGRTKQSESGYEQSGSTIEKSEEEAEKDEKEQSNGEEESRDKEIESSGKEGDKGEDTESGTENTKEAAESQEEESDNNESNYDPEGEHDEPNPEQEESEAEHEKRATEGTENQEDSMEDFQTPKQPLRKIVVKQRVKAKGKKKIKTVGQRKTTRSQTKALKEQTENAKKRKRNTMASRHPRLAQRNPPRLFVETVKNMTDMQKGWIKRMGLGKLLELEIRSIPHCLGYWLVDNFEPSRCELTLANGKALHIKEEDVEHVLGLPRGEMVIERRKKKDRSEKLELWKEECGATEIRPSQLVEKMSSCDKPEDEGRFRQHFIGFFIALLLESNLKGSCMVELFIDDVDNIERMNWCKLVVECLVHSRLQWEKKKKSNFQGPILFLLLFYVDRVTVLGKSNPETDPVFKGWNDRSLKKRERDEEEVGGFGNGHVREAPTKKRTEEKDDDRRTVEDSTLLLKEKTIVCEESIKDLVKWILQMDKEVRSQAIIQDKIKAVKMLIGETQFLLHRGEKMDNEMWERAERVEGYRRQLVEDMRMEEDNEIGIDENLRSMDEEETGLRENITNVQRGEGGDIRNDIIETETGLEESLNDVQDVAEIEKTMKEAEKTTKDVAETEKTMEQHEETPKKVTKKRKEAAEVGDKEELLENKRPKRTTKAAAELRSPFLNRVAKIISATSEEEKLTWAYIFTDASIKSSIEQVFKCSGREATKAMMRSLDKTVDPNVIDIWSFLINKQEIAKSAQKPARVCMTVYRYNAREDEENWEEMEKQLEDAVVKDENRKIKEIDMILIPVMLKKNHYILLAINLKFPAIEILDGSSSVTTPTKEQQDATTKIMKFVGSFLTKHKLHHKKKIISAAKLSILQLPWTNSSNPATSGVYCMRHMEAYMGAQYKVWETEMKADNMEGCQKRLRVIYLNKIVMSELNEVKTSIKKKMDAYKKEVVVLKNLVVTGK